MDLATAALIFSTKLMDSTHNPNWGPYDHQTMEQIVTGIVKATTDIPMVETLIRIARWESGGFRADVANCKILGKIGERGVFQVLPSNEKEKTDLCSSDFAVQAAVTITHVNTSINTCKKYGLKDSNLLTAYTHGHCLIAKGKEALLRWGTGHGIFLVINANAGDSQ